MGIGTKVGTSHHNQDSSGNDSSSFGIILGFEPTSKSMVSRMKLKVG